MSVDNRVVNMQFNNEEFEKRAGETKQTVDDLNESLNGLGRDADSGPLRNALNGVGDAVEGVGEKFNALETFVAGIFLRLGSDVAEFGEKMVKSLSIDQVEAGFEKYQNKISNVSGLKNVAKYQGYGYEEVEKVLDELSWYADATSYDMNAMTTALLSMTNSGADLKKAAKTIEGMANSFSYAGATATKVTGAFSMLSKAMGEGSKLGAMVYNSLSNVYKVIPAELEQKFIDVAVANEKLVKNSKGVAQYIKTTNKGVQKLDVTIGNFKDTLSYGWLTSDVLTEVYNTYGAYSRKIYKLQAQYKEETGLILSTSEAMDMYDKQMQEAGKTIDEFGKAAFESAMEAKTFEEAVDATKDAVSSQFSAIFESIFGDYEKAKVLFTDLNDWMVSTFAQPIANLAALVEEWSVFQTGLSDEGDVITARDNLIQSFKNIWGAYQSYVAPLRLAWKDLFPSLTVDGLVDFTLKFEEFTKKIKLGDEAAETLQTIAHAAFQLVKGGVGAVKILVDTAKTVFGYARPIIDIIESIALGIAGVIEKIAEFLEDIGFGEKAVSTLSKKFSNIKTEITQVYRDFTNGSTVAETVSNAFKDAGVTFEELGNGLKNTAKLFTDAIHADEIEADFGGITTAAVGAFGVIATESSKAAAKTKGFIDTLNSEDVLSKWQKFKEKIEWIIGGILGHIKLLFQKMSGAFKTVGGKELTLYEKYMQDIQGQTTLFGKILDGVFTILKGYFTTRTIKSVGDFFTAMTVGIKNVNPLASLGRVFDSLSERINKFGKKTKSEAFKEIAIGLLILSAALWALTKVASDPNLETAINLMWTLVNVAGSLMILSTILERWGGSGARGIGATFAGLGVGLLLIVSSMNMMKGFTSDEITQALTGIISILLVITAMIAITEEFDKTGGKSIQSVGPMIAKMGAGFILMAEALKIIADVPKEDFARGLLGIGLMSGIVLGFMLLMTKMQLAASQGKHAKQYETTFAQMGAAFIGLGVAMGLMAIALGAMSLIPVEKFLVVMAGMIALMGVFVHISSKSYAKDMLLTATSLVIVAAAMQLMAIGMASMALLGKNMANGIVGLMGVMALLGIMSAFTSGADLIMTAGAIALIGITLPLLANGIKVFSELDVWGFIKGLTLMAITFGAIGLSAFLLAPAIPLMSAFFTALGVAGVGLGHFIAKLLLALAVIEVMGPERLAKMWVNLITSLCVAIAASVDPIVEALTSLAYGIGKAAIGIMTNLMIGIWDGAKAAWNKMLGRDNDVEEMGSGLGKGLLSGIGKKLFGGGEEISTGLANTVLGSENDVANASNTIGETVTDNMSTGMETNAFKVTDAFSNLVGDDAQAVAKEGGEQAGANSALGFVEGMKDENGYVKANVSSMFKEWLNAGNVALEIKSPSRAFARTGKYSILGFVKGLKDNGRLAEHAVVDMFTNTKDALRYAIDEIDSAMPLDDSLTIRPVLDLSQIQNGANDISKMLNGSTIDTKLQTEPLPASYMMSSMGNDINDLRAVVSGIDLGKDNASIGEYVRSALEGMGVYMNGRQVGSMITGYQTNLGRARGV